MCKKYKYLDGKVLLFTQKKSFNLFKELKFKYLNLKFIALNISFVPPLPRVKMQNLEKI